MVKLKTVFAQIIAIALILVSVVVSFATGETISASASSNSSNYGTKSFSIGGVKIIIRDASQLPANSTYKLNGIGGSFPIKAGGVFLEYGEYPRTYVGNTKNSQLEQLYSTALGSELVATGKTYTSNSFNPRSNPSWAGANTSGGYEGHENPEYEYQGKKYVRHEIMRFTDENTVNAKTNAINEETKELYGYDSAENNMFDQEGIAWFTVEPIRWLIANWSQMPKAINPNGTGTASAMQLLAIDQITSGVAHEARSLTYPFEKTLWKNSRVRTFLNGTTNDENTRQALANIGDELSGIAVGETTGNPFIVDAFSSKQRALIKTKTIRNSKLPETFDDERDITSTEQYDPENETMDKIFLLSYNQVFGTSDQADGRYRTLFEEGTGPTTSRIAATTDWAFGNLAWSNDTSETSLGTLVGHLAPEGCNLMGAGAWWLRSAYSHNRISRVFYSGEEFKCYTYNPSYGIRPAMYLSIEELETDNDHRPLIIIAVSVGVLLMIGAGAAGVILHQRKKPHKSIKNFI